MSRAQCRQLLLPAPQAGRARPAWRGCRPGCQLKGLVRFALLNGIKRMCVFCAAARAQGLFARALWAQALAGRRCPAAAPWGGTCLWAQVLRAMGQLARAIKDPAILFHRNHVQIAEGKSRFCAMEAMLGSAARGMPQVQAMQDSTQGNTRNRGNR